MPAMSNIFRGYGVRPGPIAGVHPKVGEVTHYCLGVLTSFFCVLPPTSFNRLLFYELELIRENAETVILVVG